MKVDRVRITHVERGRQAQLASNPYGENAAMDKDYNTRPRGCRLQNWLDSRIVYRITMHCGEVTNSAQADRQGTVHTLDRIGRQRIHHEVTIKPAGEPGGAHRHRHLICGDTRNQGGARNTAVI